MKKQFTVQILKGGGSRRLFHTDTAGTSLSITVYNLGGLQI